MDIKKYLAVFIILTLLSSCKKEIELGEYKRVYMPQSLNSPHSYTISLKDEETRIVVGAALGGVEASEQEIEVSFRVDPQLVDQYNQNNATTYRLLPAAAYRFSSDKATIAIGEISSPVIELLVNGFGTLQVDQEYLLPISIADISAGVEFNEDLKTAYFLFRVTREFIDRSSWTVFDTSTEEPGENMWGGTGGGEGRHAIDGMTGTYWHTQWDGGQPAPPHHIAFDMDNNQTVNGFVLINRNNRLLNGGNPQNITVQFSTSGSVWSQKEEFILENIDGEQQIDLAIAVQARYFRITVNSTYIDMINNRPNPSTHIAEVYAF
ncbi:BT_3987 domain-containing protein [Sphingobacterium pedocola]|uniref:F5/8 type C domain-containing protein n=1 Tax=Sphingobacterium pedocola TaxID=2082722 RepID=A0ABR9T9H9_9SPHI|nr:DUF1735 domain-containing protein [Sphingobacterium pedocola]MBE8721554.1 hypothetical protein [Sphingobacterium pedocola]